MRVGRSPGSRPAATHPAQRPAEGSSEGDNDQKMGHCWRQTRGLTTQTSPRLAKAGAAPTGFCLQRGACLSAAQTRGDLPKLRRACLETTQIISVVAKSKAQLPLNNSRKLGVCKAGLPGMKAACTHTWVVRRGGGGGVWAAARSPAASRAGGMCLQHNAALMSHISPTARSCSDSAETVQAF